MFSFFGKKDHLAAPPSIQKAAQTRTQELLFLATNSEFLYCCLCQFSRTPDSNCTLECLYS